MEKTNTQTKSARPGRGYIAPCKGSGIYCLTAFDAFATCNRGQHFLNLRCMTDGNEQLNLDIPLPELDADGVPTRGNGITDELQFFFNLSEFPAWRANPRSRNTFTQFKYFEFCGRPFHAIVQFVGMRVSKKGYEYPNHRFYGLCDELGRAPLEILENAPAPGMRYRAFLQETSIDPTEMRTEQLTDPRTDDPIADLYTALKTLSRG